MFCKIASETRCSVMHQKANIPEVSVKRKCFVGIQRCLVVVVVLVAAMMIERELLK